MNTEQIRDALKNSKGQWRKISIASGVPYDTLTKFAQGHVKDPRSSTTDKLSEYFAAKVSA